MVRRQERRHRRRAHDDGVALEGRQHDVDHHVRRGALANGKCQRYFLPITRDWETRTHDPLEKYASHALAKVRQRDRVGIFYAAFADPEFPRALVRAMGEGGEAPLGKGHLRFSHTARFAQSAGAVNEEVRVPALEQSNTAVFFGNRLFLKGYRRMREGVNPELELGRFLTEASPFPHIAPVLGAVEYLEGDAEPVTLAMLQQFVENQGDLWTLTCQHLGRLISMPDAATGQGDRGIGRDGLPPRAHGAPGQPHRRRCIARSR